MTKSYDAKRGRLQTAMSLKSTVVPSVLRSTEFWLFLAIHLFVYFSNGTLAWQDTFKAIHLDWHFVKVITAMTTFFEVFYANQCYARYMTLYAQTRSMLNEAYAFVYTLRVMTGDRCRGQTRLSVRYMTAAMLLNFYGLKTGTCDDAALAELRRLEILKPPEAELLQRQEKHHRAVIMLAWSSCAARMACESAQAPSAAQRCITALMQLALQIRRYKQEITDTLSLPVPFQYFHLLSVMIIMNLALWAFSMGCSDSLFAPVVFVFASTIFIGMMELSSELADPFGSDDVDFPVADWMKDCVELLAALAEFDVPIGIGGPVEEEIPLPRRFLGSAVLAGNSHRRGGPAALPTLLREPTAATTPKGYSELVQNRTLAAAGSSARYTSEDSEGSYMLPRNFKSGSSVVSTPLAKQSFLRGAP